ncbi:hypothetical protein GCM10017764_11960 [Sphingobacterium griseoflavum]|uniref:2-C-methyl-D-erythritol 4-phosphate cytidylyltransferase n=2 Tax=Sphingobacterium griseoflavum TaxID=1474952 RepID=A0ABQ3HSK8_9SPHI|nr:hypothetical protein GCM10017764_11960 [Sphingobacterium griseoflavum]
MQTYWADLCSQYHFVSPHRVLDGGESRFQSVKNGIMKILESEKSPLEDILIAIHDAARPVVSAQLIAKCFTETAIHGATTLALQSTNSVRLGDMQHSEATNRERVWIIQTPQTFKASILKEAFAQPELATFTDDASVVEKMGYRIHLIPGEYSNLKITFPEDIAIAQLYLHALKAKRPLV